MKFLSDHNVNIALSRRFIGNEEHGQADVYQLYMEVLIGGERFTWGYLIIPQMIVHLQEFIKKGIEALRRKFDEMVK